MLFFLCNCSDDNSSDALEVILEENEVSNFVGGPLIISEVSPLNENFKDFENDDDGFIELLNTSIDTIDLNGIYLTDSKNNPKKWAFGNVKIAPHEFMIVFMSKKNLPDYVAPHDSIDMIGPGCWTWTDIDSDPPGYSYANPLEGKSKNCFKENNERRFGAVMKFGENEELGWSSIAVFVGTRSSSKDDVLDISKTNEILMHAYITKDKRVSFRLAQSDVDDWKAYEIEFVGTGDSSTIYQALLPTNSTFPDLENIYGTRMGPGNNEAGEVTVKVFSYIARNKGNFPHSNFKLNKEGGFLYLYNSNSEILDSIQYPKVPHGKSFTIENPYIKPFKYGFATPSPNSLSVETVYETQVQNIESSNNILPSGFYQNPFIIDFSNSGEVHCEINGKLPTKESPLTQSITINATTTLRCMAFENDALPSEVLNRTYVFEDAPKVPVMFVSADPNSLFDPDSGIYMEGNNAQEKEPHYGANYWLDKELPVFVEFFEPSISSVAFAKNAGLKIFGNYSRMREKKSVSITFREKYGDSRLNYALFPEHPNLNKFKAFLLRNNGNNCGVDYIRDRLASSISEGLSVDYQRGRGVIVYYNGEYFGIHNIRERSTEYYFETHYGLDPNHIDLLKADNSVTAGSSVDYEKMINWLKENPIDDEENYEYLKTQMDVNNFINYVHIELFVNNRDWPSNNLKKWRSNSPKSPWKWFLYDMDFSFGTNYSEYTNNIFEFATEENGENWPNGPEHTFLLRTLLENESFKSAFVNRMLVLLQMNFESSRILKRIDVLMNEIESEISRDSKRWNTSENYKQKQLDIIKDFAQSRQEVVAQELQEFFGLEEYIPVTLSVSGNGFILVHNLKLDASPLTVNFAKNFLVQVSAAENPGAVFVGWSDGILEKERIINPADVQNIQAIFK